MAGYCELFKKFYFPLTRDKFFNKYIIFCYSSTISFMELLIPLIEVILCPILMLFCPSLKQISR